MIQAPEQSRPIRPNYRIYRNDRGGCHGWAVHITVVRQRQTRYFPDSKYGSKAASLKAAKAYAHKDLDLHIEYLALRRRLQARSNSRSGIPGVGRFRSKRHGQFWAAYFDDPVSGKRKMKRFSVLGLGEDGARELAIEYRTERMKPYIQRLSELEALLFTGSEA